MILRCRQILKYYIHYKREQYFKISLLPSEKLDILIFTPEKSFTHTQMNVLINCKTSIISLHEGYTIKEVLSASELLAHHLAPL